MASNTTPSPRVSLAAMAPPKAPAPTRAPSLFEELRQLDAQLVAGGSDKNERATTLIAACAESNVRTPGQVIAVLTRLGFKRGHIGALTSKGNRTAH